MEEAQNVFEDLKSSPLKLLPDIVTYNSFLKVQLSAGDLNAVQVFKTYNKMQEEGIVAPNLATFTLLLRACALFELEQVGEEIFSYATQIHLPQAKEKPTMQFYNAMLDVYAESRSEQVHRFFEYLIKNNFPVNAQTFNIYAKACIFKDERHRLPELAELMRVEGIVQRDLGKPIRQEIAEAYEKHTTPYNPAKEAFKEYKQGGKRLDFFANIRYAPPAWGRRVDQWDYLFFNKLMPYIKKYTIDTEKLLKLIPHVEMKQHLPTSLEHINVDTFEKTSIYEHTKYLAEEPQQAEEETEQNELDEEEDYEADEYLDEDLEEDFDENIDEYQDEEYDDKQQ